MILDLKMLPSKTFHMHNPLCRTLPLPTMTSILEVGVHLLINEFKNAYKDGDMVLYVYLVDKDGKFQDVITEIIKGWDLHRCDSNNALALFISHDLDAICMRR